MTSTIKVDTIQDSGGNTIISSDGSGTITQTASIGSFSSTGIDDNASSTAITINSSGNVGIGTTSPSTDLEIVSSATSLSVLPGAGGYAAFLVRSRNNSNNNSFAIVDKAGTGGAGGMGIYQYNASGTYTREAFTIKGNGLVGIGSTDPSYNLDVQSAADPAQIRLKEDGNTTGFIVKNYNGSEAQLVNADNGPMVFKTNDSEAMRIDSSGNLLVGTTDTLPHANNNVGVAIPSGSYGGFISASRDNATVMGLNRKTSDGVIIDFKKDGTSIGRIGTKNSELVIGTGDTGVSFVSGQNALVPKNPATNVNANNQLDLGIASARWNDLYLGGNIYLGGTGSANALDDYEEGTWTATLGGASSEPGTLITTTAVYKKIGSLVMFQLGFEAIDNTGYAGRIKVTGLPFTNTSNSRSIVNVGIYNIGLFSSNADVIGVISQSGSQIDLQEIRSANTWGDVDHVAGSNRYLWITGTYSQA